MFIELLNKLTDSREIPEKEPPYIEPVEPYVKPTEIPVKPTETPQKPMPEKQDKPLPETPPIKPQ